jgi:putative inorganic carbon (HCO3(-)) transporter
VKQQLKTAACRIADLELVVVLLGVAPVLIFDAWVPKWAIAAALAVIPVLWLIRWLGCGSPIRATPLDVPILLLLLMVPVGVWAAASKSLSLPQIYRIILGVSLFYAAVGTLISARRLWFFTAWLLIAVPVLALIALLGTQLPGSKFPLSSVLYDWIPTFVRPFWRPAGLGPNSVAGGLVLLLPLTVGFALGGWSRWLRISCALASLFACSVLVLTQSRGALVGLVLAVLVMFIAWNRWFLLAIPAVMLGGLAALGALGVEWLSQLMLSITATSAVASLEGRLEIWTRALYMIQDFPITGVGLGMFDHIMDLLYPLFTVSPETNIFHPHNMFLSQAVSSGLPGLVGLLALIFLLVVMALQSIGLSRRAQAWPLAVGLLGALAAYLGHGMFDSPTSFVRASAILWILFGLQVSLWLHLREHQAVCDSAERQSTR